MTFFSNGINGIFRFMTKISTSTFMPLKTISKIKTRTSIQLSIRILEITINIYKKDSRIIEKSIRYMANLKKKKKVSKTALLAQLMNLIRLFIT